MDRQQGQHKKIVFGAACAVSLSLSLLAGCTRPPGSTLLTASSKSAHLATGGAVGSNATSPQGTALSFMTITGKATFQGQPLANADLHVVDALNDAVAPVVAAGGGNIVAAGGGNIVAAGGGNIVAAGGGNIVAAGGGNIVAAGGGNIVAAGGGNIVAAGGGNIVAAGGGNLRTDAQGNFSVQVAGLTGGNAARLVVAAGGSAVSTLVTGGGGLMGKYTIQQAGGAMQAPINEVTTTISHLANGTLKLSRLLRREASGPIINEMLTGLRGKAEQFQQEFDRQQSLGNALVQETDPTTGAPKNSKNSVLPVVIGNAGVRKAVFDLNKATLKAIAKAATDPQNQAPNRQQVQQELQGVPLAGTGLTISLTDSSLSVRTSSGTTIDLSTSDSSKLDTALNSTTFEQSFAPPATSSGSGGGSSAVDTTPPDAPTILDISGESDSGLRGDFKTNDTTPDLVGTAEANATVDIYKGGAKIATARANDWGNWTVTLPALSDGDHDFTAIATDARGNASPASTVFTITIDSSIGVPGIAGMTAATDSGYSNNDLITNINTPMLKGTAEANAQVEFFDNGNTLTLISTTADASGNWTVELPALGGGVHSLVAKATDKAGNSSAGSTPITFTIDLTAPTTPTSAPDLAEYSDTGASNTDNRTVDATPTFTGNASDEFVNVYDGATKIASYVQVIGGTWTFTPPNAWTDVHVITAKAVDRAGNESIATPTPLTVTISPTLVENVSVGVNPFGMAVDLAGNTWVANSTSHNVTRISPSGNMTPFSVGTNPKNVAADTFGNTWVTNQGSNNVTRINSSGVFSTYTVGAAPTGLAVDGSGNAWVTNQNSGTVSRISSAGVFSTYTVGTTPQAIVVDRIGNAWVANNGSSNVTRISSTGSISTFPVGSGPTALAVDPSNTVWVANKNSGSVMRVTSASSVSYTVGAYPYAMAIDTLGNVWVANSSSSNVTRVSQDGTLTTFPVGASPKALAVDAANNVWVANFDSNTVTRIGSNGFISTFPTGSNPYNLAIAANGNVWVANYGSSNVTCISIP